MAIFIVRPQRHYEINDYYFVLIVYVLSFWLTKKILISIEKYLEKKKKKENPDSKKILYTRGGELNFDFTSLISEEILTAEEMSEIILTCIQNDTNYNVMHSGIKKAIAEILMMSFRNKSIIISGNLFRLFALEIRRKNRYQPLIVRLGKTLVASSTRNLLFLKLKMGILFGGITGTISWLGNLTISTIISLSIYMWILFEMSSQYNCDRYFKELPAHEIMVASDRNNLIISDEPTKISLFVPVPKSQKIMDTLDSDVKFVGQNYRKSRKKAKVVKFRDFQRTDPILSRIRNLDEPEVPPKNRGNSIEGVEVYE